jgi:uncharacterized protein DUF551
MKKISITSMQELVIDEDSGTCFIEDDRYREVLHIYLPTLIKELINVTEKYNSNTDDFFWKQNNWIKCSDKLPEVFEEVLVYSIHGGKTVANLIHDKSKWNLNPELFNLNFITHWMRLPEPPNV